MLSAYERKLYKSLQVWSKTKQDELTKLAMLLKLAATPTQESLQAAANLLSERLSRSFERSYIPDELMQGQLARLYRKLNNISDGQILLILPKDKKRKPPCGGCFVLI